MANFFALLLLILIIYNTIQSLIHFDFSEIWSPINILSLTYIYYCIIPFYMGTSDIYDGVSVSTAEPIFLFSAFLSYFFICIGFKINTTFEFTKWNNILDEYNSRKLGILLFIIALLFYIPINGFQLSIFAEDDVTETENSSLAAYFNAMIDLFVASCSLLLISREKKLDIIYFFILLIVGIVYIITGYRYHLVLLMISMATCYYLYPIPKKINYLLMGLVFIISYMGFSIIEVSRNYGRGLDKEVVTAIDEDILTKGPIENLSVYVMSALSTEYYENEEKLYFEPIVNAILMPIPRSLISWKPDGAYTKNTQLKLFGTIEYGAACLFFVEAFMSWGWLGIILYSFLVGLLSKVFWNNYKNNSTSIGAILLLALYNSYVYVLVSRGYLAQELRIFIFHLLMPFWLFSMIVTFFPSLKNFCYQDRETV